MKLTAPGQTAHVNDNWPRGIGEIVNDKSRTHGWNDWFSEWPSDVNQYAFKIASQDDLQRLIQKLASVKGEKRINLCLLSEPSGLGWVTSLDEGNNIPVMFSIGDQHRIDQWYGQVRKPFGKIEFEDVPVAVPPTLTLFVGHKSIDLKGLEIPDSIQVQHGYVPTVFHKWNTKREKEREKKPTPPLSQLEPEQQKVHEAIEQFLKQRSESSPQTPPE